MAKQSRVNQNYRVSNVMEMDSLKSGHDIYIKAHMPHI